MSLSDKPRLLVVASTYPRFVGDSTPSFVHSLCLALRERFDVMVVAPGGANSQDARNIDGIPVMRFQYAPTFLQQGIERGGLLRNMKASPWKVCLLPGYLISMIWAVRRAALMFRPDVVHVHWFFPAALAFCLSGLKVPFVVTSHGSDVLRLRGPSWQRMRRWIGVRAEAVTAVGATIACALELDGLKAKAVIPMGVDTKRFALASQERGKGRLLFVGALASEKRPEVAIQMLQQLVADCRDASLDIAGDGPARVELERLVWECELQGRVRFHGSIDHAGLAMLYAKAAVLVMPSGNAEQPEGFGLVAVEALCTGCRVLSVHNVALEQALPAGLPIIYLSRPEPALFAQAYLSDDRVQLLMSEMEAVTRLRHAFSWEVTGQRYAAVLEDALSTRGRVAVP